MIMSQSFSSVIRQNVPWRRSVAWWVVLIEGLLALAIGIYCIIQTIQVAQTILLLIAVYLIVTSILNVVSALRKPVEDKIVHFAVSQSIVGLVTGLLVVLQSLLQIINERDARIILATGLLIFGLIGMYGSSMMVPGKSINLAGIIGGLLSIVLAVLLFFFSANNLDILRWIGWIATIAGTLLIVYSLVLYRASKQQRIPATTG
jgi:uncharacterized membrane protein HdeD (DUF308 family)